MTKRRRNSHLWQVALRHLTEGPIDSLYPLDRVHIIRMLRDLHAVGERPDVETFTRYAKRLWPEWGSSERWVCDTWRQIYRNPRHRFKIMHGFEYDEQPFHLLEHLIETLGLEPIEPRLRRVARRALETYSQAAVEGSREQFDDARGELNDAIKSIVLLRRARFGGPLEDT